MLNNYIAGVDIGGTKISASIANKERILCKLSLPVEKKGSNTAIPEQIIVMLEQLCEYLNINYKELNNIGICSCGPFLKTTGEIELVSPNLCGHHNQLDLGNDWKTIPLERVLKKHYEHIVIENDAVAGMLAERQFGSLKGENNCIYATWSTGLGFGICLDGHPLRGKNGNAGHLGHSFVRHSGQHICGCGNQGDAESAFSSTGLSQTWGDTTLSLFHAAKQGDEVAIGIILSAINGYAELLYNIIVALDIKKIAIGGSVFSNNKEFIFPILEDFLFNNQQRQGMKIILEGVEIIPASLGDNVADFGALILVMPDEWLNFFELSSVDSLL